MAYFNCYGAENDTLKWHFEFASKIFVTWFLLSAMKNGKNTPFLKKNVEDTICMKKKKHPFDIFLDMGAYM